LNITGDNLKKKNYRGKTKFAYFTGGKGLFTLNFNKSLLIYQLVALNLIQMFATIRVEYINHYVRPKTENKYTAFFLFFGNNISCILGSCYRKGV
jgi:hypothetical protein